MDSSSNATEFSLRALGYILLMNSFMVAILLVVCHLDVVDRRECVRIYFHHVKTFLPLYGLALTVPQIIRLLYKKNILKLISRVFFGPPPKRIIDVLEQLRIRYSLALWSMSSVAIGCVCFRYFCARCTAGNALDGSEAKNDSNNSEGIIMSLLSSLYPFLIINPFFLIFLLICCPRTGWNRRETLSFCVNSIKAYFLFYMFITYTNIW